MRHDGHRRASAVFGAILARWRAVLIASAGLSILLGFQLTHLVKDTSIDAFLSPDNPARIYRDTVKDVFGLEDAIVVAVVNDAPGGVYAPDSLALVSWLTDKIRMTDGVDPERVISVATEKNIYGKDDELVIEPLLAPSASFGAAASSLPRAIERLPLYHGTLISKDGRGAMIIAEVLRAEDAEAVYERILSIADSAPAGGEVYVAGEGAAQGYLASYIDADARKLQPLAFVTILIVVAIAFRNVFAILASLAIIVFTVSSSLGSMAAFGIPYFAITGALPIILIGMSIIDAVHILNHYYAKRRLQLHQEKREAIVETMAEIWRPIVLTTLTTIAGFVGVAITAAMPPMIYFALFAIVGLAAALIASLTLLPCLLLIYPAHDSAAYKPREQQTGSQSWLQQIGAFFTDRHMISLAFMGLVALMVASQARELTIDRKLITNFKADEPIRIADGVINSRFAGSNFLDVVIEADAPEGILEPEALRKIERLQEFGESLSFVSKSQSIADYLKLMNRAVNADSDDYFTLPETFEEAAQYMLLYSASADPQDFAEEIDPHYETALVRFYLTTDRFSEFAPVVTGMQNYIDANFQDSTLTANMSGRVALAYEWIAPLGRNHFLSVFVSLLFITALSTLLFRSVSMGLLTVVPVVLTLVAIYGVMGYAGIWLEPATYMFAAIALGLGVDFSIHMIERIQFYMDERGEGFDSAAKAVYGGPARALFTNCTAVGLGFSLLMLSELPTINRFGFLTAVALGASFLFSFFFIPSLVKWVKPKAIFHRSGAPRSAHKSAAFIALLCIGAGLTFLSPQARAEALPSGEEVSNLMQAREDGSSFAVRLEMTMVSRKGRERRRTARILRLDDASVRKLMIRFIEPDSIDGTAFLTFDYRDAGETDDQWIYLPALRRERRITPGDRGDYFFGTDFTYEDVKDSTKFDPADFELVPLKRDSFEGADVIIVSVFPRSEKIAEEVGYSRAQAWIDPESWMPVRADYWDIAGNPLKTISIVSYERISGYWTPLKIVAENAKTGHSTVFDFSDITYDAAIDEGDLTVRAMKRNL